MKPPLRTNKHSFFLTALLLSTTTLLQADTEEGYQPLYAGTQLAFYPINTAPGHLSVQPYLTYLCNYGTYNSHWSEKSQKKTNGVLSLFILETGITDWLDISLDLNGAYRRYGDKNSWIVGDTSIYFGLQMSRDKKDHWAPDLRLLIGETFPSGKYDRLSPHKGGSDIFGTGAYLTTTLLVIAKTFYTNPQHPFNINLNLYYIHPSSVPIHGLSLYGGSPDTKGTAYPHSSFITNIGIECSLDKYWALGMDIRYVHQNKTTFKGRKGSPLKLRLPSSEQFSLAPCIEYSWSYDFSAAIGPWFTIAGRNSVAFFGLVGNIYCYF